MAVQPSASPVCRRGWCSGAAIGDEGFCAEHQALVEARRKAIRAIRGSGECGTDAGYQRHRRAREIACEACKAAHTKYWRLREDARRTESAPVTHIPATMAS